MIILQIVDQWNRSPSLVPATKGRLGMEVSVCVCVCVCVEGMLCCVLVAGEGSVAVVLPQC